jgi:hypothetical protein
MVGVAVRLVRRRLGGVMDSVLATVPKVYGLNSGRGRWIFRDDKNPQKALLGGRRKDVGPMS